MKRIAGAAFVLFTLQLAAGTPQEQSNSAAPGYFYGRVTDETGKAVMGVPVRAFQSAVDLTDARKLKQVAAVRSDDRGDYHLSELQPGRYYIVIGGPGSASDPPSTRQYAVRFYPGVRDITQATTPEIFPGKATNADLRAVLE